MRNQRGQAAIFVALMFNVFFIFFAMCINVAMVVHDKINLQNSMDLAAYYAAGKQAEILNVIAHENYMIRQSYKLLAWRYHVLGTMGIYRAPSPKNPVWTGETQDSVYQPSVSPSVCVTYKPTWLEVPDGESLCNTENLKIPPLPSVPIIAGFIGANAAISQLADQLRQQFDAQCEKHGAYNWWFSMSILQAFRTEQRNRRQIIDALAKDLKGDGSGDFKDLDGNSVLQGAQQTFVKNLTYANRNAFQSGSFEIYNSLASIDVTKWLVPIEIVPTVLYTDVDQTEGCNASTQPIANLPQRPQAQQLLYQPFPQGFNAGNLVQWSSGGYMPGSEWQYSIGYEKNPWYMAYIGVKASVTPKQIFFPLGNGVQMTARAFAKPFGGRIGPWYKSNWSQGEANSSGSLVDPLMAPREVGGGGGVDTNDPKRLPNYARYPGDQVGMSSKLAINSLNGLASLGISFDYYKNVAADISTNDKNDTLAWDSSGNQAPAVRSYEILAIAPDLFDIAYYSIEPDFGANYLPRLKANASALGIGGDVPIRGDLGSNTQKPAYSIQDQIALQLSQQLQRTEAYYFVRDKKHLLTAWLPGPGAFNYDVSAAMANFATCAVQDDNLKYKNPGSCIAGGGRTGYSVKLVGRDALLSSKHQLGGSGTGAIANPPPSDW